MDNFVDKINVKVSTLDFDHGKILYQ